MARTQRLVDVSASSFMVGTVPMPKVRDEETGELAVDRVTSETLYVTNLMQARDGAAEMIKVTIPESGIPEKLKVGALVKPVKLVTFPWANTFGEQINSGLAYRADGLELA
jgi:hypothetical protein